MSTIVGVQFRNTGKIYYFAPGKLTFAKGEGAIVETARGLEYGEVMIANCEVDESEIKGELKKVVRKATPKDTANYNSNLARRPKAIRDAQAMANKRNLDMKVVDTEFCFDGSKAIFYLPPTNVSTSAILSRKWRRPSIAVSSCVKSVSATKQECSAGLPRAADLAVARAV